MTKLRSRPTRRRAHSYEVGSVRKALEILCSFTVATPLWTLTEVSEKLKIPKSTALNLLRTLESFGLLTKDRHTKRYQLGPKVYQLNPLLELQSWLVARATPHIARLAEETGETIKLGVLSNRQVLVLSAVESKFVLHTRGDQGCLAPLHCTSIGKALLASLTGAELDEILKRGHLSRCTDHTITQRSRLEEDLAKIRQIGYSVDNEENEVGVRCIGATVSAPGGYPLAAISISGPSNRITPDAIRKLAPLMMDVCRMISASLATLGVPHLGGRDEEGKISEADG